MRTVAGTLEAALSRLFVEPVKVTAAGRTDAGVHASGQVVSCVTGRAFPFERLTVALAGLLPADCSVREAAVVADGFSARFDARERTYVYAVVNRPRPSALLVRYVSCVSQPLDLDAMRAAAEHLIGKQDFRSFAAVAAEERTVRELRRIELGKAGDLLRIEVAADGFLHHMVRTIVGTLIECGTARREPSDVARVLAARDRAAAGPTAPPQGLYLAGVRYEDGYDSFAEPPILA